MPKPVIRESRFDFRGGRNTAVGPDLLNPNELVDTTNARLVDSYGAIKKRSGCQRIHASAFPAAINGVFQWDTASGKQTVVVSGGQLYYRDGLSYTPGFTAATTSSVMRTTASQGSSCGWSDPDGLDDGKNVLTGVTSTSTVSAGNRILLKIGDTTPDTNANAVDDLYTVTIKLTADGTALTGEPASAIAKVQFEVSLTGGGAYSNVGNIISVTAGPGESVTQEFTLVLSWSGATAWFRPILTVTRAGAGAGGTAGGTVQCFSSTYLTNNYPATWTTGQAALSTTQPAIFAPFRESTSSAQLLLYIASGGHLFEWDGDAKTLTQLDPTDGAPLATAIISYHTRMFAMTANPATLGGGSLPSETPKTIYWSKIGDATNFTATGLKSDGGAAVTDFLTGQHLTALEVIGSSLLMATDDSVMRFTGQSSDDIVISQNTEGVSAEVGAVGLQALKRFENVAGMLARRGPYVVNEVSATPLGEAVLPDFDALDSSALHSSVLAYNQGRKELLFAVPGASDSALNKTIFVFSSRLQCWYGPWTYSFGINSMANYLGDSGIESVIAGCSDGFVRLMDVGNLDDVTSAGSGGSNITMTVEIPTMHFGRPGVVKNLGDMKLQAVLPSGHALQVLLSFDGETADTGVFIGATYDGTLRDYRVDLGGMGLRPKIVFTDASTVLPQINGFVLTGYDMKRP